MRKLILLLLLFGITSLSAQIPKELQGYWQFKVDKPGDWNGFEIGENYIEGFYQVYKVRSVQKIDGKIQLTLDAPDNIIYEFQENVGQERKVKINKRQDTLLCTRYDRDPDIEYMKVTESTIAGTKWRNAKALSEFISFEGNSINLGDQNWKIKWFGKYKFNNEYRALVEDNGTHRLLYLTSNLNSLKMVYDMKPYFYAKEGPFPAIYHLLGNWYDSKSNDWRYGFFEEFALIDGVPAFYSGVDKTKDGFKVTFFENKKYKPLYIKVDGNNIGINKITYHKVDKFLPNYKGEDKQAFYDSEFKKMDTAYISGYIRNNNSTNPFSVEVTNWLNGETENFYGDIDEYGFFTVKVPLYNTTQVFMDWRRSNFLDVLTPGERYFVFKDLSTGETMFRGDNERFHNELVKYSDYSSKNNISPKTNDAWRAKDKHERSLKDTAYLYLKLAQLDSLRKIDLDFINQSNLSSRSKYYINKNTDYNIARELMQKKFQLNYQTKEKFSDVYMNIVKKNFFDNNIKPLSIVRDNQRFLKDYLDYYTNQKFPQSSDVLLQMNKIGQIKLTDSLKIYALEMSKITNSGKNINVDSLDKIFPNLNRTYNDILNENRELLESYFYLQGFILNPLSNYKQIAKAPIVEVFYTRNILQRFKSNPNPIHPVFLEQLLGNFTNSYLRNVVISENQKLKEIAVGEFKYKNNLKNTDHLKEAKDADKIIAEILSAHKGKVVYMDFWGTWCAPCVAEMEYAPAAKKAMENKDVVFIYMANATPKSAWENFIKAKDLEGKNVYHYNLPTEQQSMVERRLEVPHFPTYMLFNKQGELVNKQAPRPSNLNTLIKEVDKLLE